MRLCIGILPEATLWPSRGGAKTQRDSTDGARPAGSLAVGRRPEFREVHSHRQDCKNQNKVEGGAMEESKSISTGASVNFPELLDRVDNDRELLRDLLSIFTEEFPRHFHALQEAIAGQDAKQVAIVSHTLKGMLLNLAVTKAAASAGQLEQQARSGGDPSSLKEAFAEFEHDVHGLLPEMETYMAEEQP